MSDEHAKLRMLVDAATPGPWTCVDGDECWTIVDHDEVPLIDVYKTDDNAEHDAALVTAACNALPGLLDRLAYLDALIKAERLAWRRALAAAEAERAEALAEIAAYQGRPEGALNAHWHYDDVAQLWSRDGKAWTLSVAANYDHDGTAYAWDALEYEGDDADAVEPEDREGEEGIAETPRSAMRAAEAAAKAKGWPL